MGAIGERDRLYLGYLGMGITQLASAPFSLCFVEPAHSLVQTSVGPTPTKNLRLREGYFLVGPTGFEPATPSPPAKCATRLRYGPTQKEGEIKCLRTVGVKPYPASC